MAGGWVHDIDPVLADVASVHLWWYGLGFALGFLQIRRFLLRSRTRLGLSRRDVWTLSLLIVAGVLVVGRSVAIAFDEWPFYREHPELMPAFWLGGMATHGLLIGAGA
jgi:phosphatidylglycerol:prolipoprotein diacylglycerol transferase